MVFDLMVIGQQSRMHSSSPYFNLLTDEVLYLLEPDGALSAKFQETKGNIQVFLKM